MKLSPATLHGIRDQGIDALSDIAIRRALLSGDVAGEYDYDTSARFQHSPLDKLLIDVVLEGAIEAAQQDFFLFEADRHLCCKGLSIGDLIFRFQYLQGRYTIGRQSVIHIKKGEKLKKLTLPQVW